MLRASTLPRKAVGLLLLLFLSYARPLMAQRPPNIVLVMTDDQGWGDVRSHGNLLLDTPNLDQLARDGARFERFFVSPVCAPTRASLLTGRYALRTGTHGVTRGWETMRSEEVTIGEVFRDAGYATGLFGKWHNGRHYPHDPNGQGFDEALAFTAGHWNNYFDTTVLHNGEPVATEGYLTDVFTDAALAFITRHRDDPFLVYLPYHTPHSPFQVPDAYYERYRAKGLDAKNASVYGMVENIDDNIGRVLDHLATLGLAEDTIVLFLTDNGPNGGDRYNGDMRGAKGSVHEGGVRVPLFVRWHGRIPPGTVVRRNALHLDLLPTLAELAGLPLPTTLPLDGRSLVPLLRLDGAPAPSDWPDRTLFSHWRLNAGSEPTPGAVRTDRWRAVNTGTGWMLFDMLSDPGERVDVAADHPERVRRLGRAYADWFAGVTSEGLEPIPAPLGHPERRVVVLPGHEALLHPATGEGIGYHERNGWSNDWVTHWTDTEAYPSWPVEVVTAGTYAVTLHYTSPPERLGTRLRVEVGEASVDGAVEQAHDPEYRFSPDRVLRGEVYEKSWQPLRLGTLQLTPGRYDLRVRALALPGGQAPDLKAVSLEKLD